MKKTQWVNFAKKNAGSRVCQCASCNLTFSSELAFNKHRKDYKCLSILAMRNLGMAINARGHWVSEQKEISYV